MRKSKTKFNKQWASLTQIGQAFGISGVAVGKILKERGWRKSTGEPTEEALGQNKAKYTPLKTGQDHYMWNKESVKNLLTAVLKRNELPRDHQKAVEWKEQIKKLYHQVGQSFDEDPMFIKMARFELELIYEDIRADMKVWAREKQITFLHFFNEEMKKAGIPVDFDALNPVVNIKDESELEILKAKTKSNSEVEL